MFDLDLPVDDAPLAFVDVETTGLRPELGDRVCEIAILRCEGPDAVDALQQLVNPEYPIGAGAQAVNRISDAMVSDAPRFPEIAADVLELIDGAVFVAHNARFDLGFLGSELDLVGLNLPPLVTLDTLALARQTLQLSSYSLGRLSESLGVDVVGDVHRAMTDVLITREVFWRLVDRLWGRGIRSVADLVDAQGGEVSYARKPRLEIPALIQAALRERRMLAIRYESLNGNETTRLVRPLGVSGQPGALSLFCHCLLRDAHRSFRLDRIRHMELVEDF